MTEASATALGDVLSTVDALPWDHALYLPADGQWTVGSSCLVLDPGEADEADEEPPLARAHGLKYALEVATVQDVITNAREQDPSADVNTLLEALRYYFENDAFIVL